MFADTLRESRIRSHLSVARLAEVAGTSRAAISDYEAGRKTPRFDTAERLLEPLGQVLTAVAIDRSRPVRLGNTLAPLMNWEPNRDLAVAKARRDQAVIVDADATAERLDVSWGQVKTLVEGVTVAGDELDVWRIRELRDSASAVLATIMAGEKPELSIIARGTLVNSHNELDIPHRALDFLIRATHFGADPAFVRHLAGGFLAHHGYPWLWVPHKLGPEYRRALVACVRQREGKLMASVLVSSIESPDN